MVQTEFLIKHFKRVKVKLNTVTSQDEVNTIICEWVEFIQFLGYKPISLGVILMNNEKIVLDNNNISC